MADHCGTSSPPRVRPPLALMLAVALLASACTEARERPAAPAQPSRPPATRSAPPQPGAVGVKWDWGRADRFTQFLRRLSGGATFFELVWCDVEPERGQAMVLPVDDSCGEGVREPVVEVRPYQRR